MTISFFVPGTPRSTQTGSVAVVARPGKKPLHIPTRRNPQWSRAFGLVAKQHRPPVPFAGPIRLEMVFRLRRPLTGRSRVRPWPTIKPDWSNLVKGLEDAMNGVIWVDDAQVCVASITKHYAMPAESVGVRVEVTELL